MSGQQPRQFEINGTIVDALNRRIFSGTISIRDGLISSITEGPTSNGNTKYICPLLGSAHTHVESSMLPPSEFARIAAVFGEGFGVHDPHEIANVLGVEGVTWMIRDGSRTPYVFAWGAPSCVPESPLVRTCAVVSAEDVRKLLELPEVYYLSEVMAFPLVLSGEPDKLAKIAAAKSADKPVDGHAPGLRGDDAIRYANAGISTDHECVSLAEALDKITAGMKILIREGSAAKNYSALFSLLNSHPDKVMFCSDDIHPNDLLRGHMDTLIRRAIKDGVDPISAIRAASTNIIQHYRLPVGMLRVGDRADFIVVDDLMSFTVKQTYIKGELVAEEGKPLLNYEKPPVVNCFRHYPLTPSDFRIPAKQGSIRVIEVHDGQLITSEAIVLPKIQDGCVVPDLDRDLLLLAVVDRAIECKPALAIVRNFGLKKGALASSVAHDSHHVVAVGTSPEEIFCAVEAVRQHGGGISTSCGADTRVLPLVYAGLMSNEDGATVARKYEELDQLAKSFGSNLTAPFMTLSFLVLSVIPSLKLSNLGLVDVNRFELTEMFV